MRMPSEYINKGRHRIYCPYEHKWVTRCVYMAPAGLVCYYNGLLHMAIPLFNGTYTMCY